LIFNLALFFICLNIGLGVAHIENTPITIPDIYKRCYSDFSSGKMEMLVYPNGTKGKFGQFLVSTNSSLYHHNNTALDPFTDALLLVTVGTNVIKGVVNVLAGGYITDTLKNINLACKPVYETDPQSPNYNKVKEYIPVVSPVWDYFTYSFGLVFILFVIFAIYYLVTGRYLPGSI